MKKGQASLEYLSTYVYAGLVLVVIVGALGYFNAFDADTYTKESCESGTQLVCKDAYVDTDGNIRIMLGNELPRDIDILDYTITYNNIKKEKDPGIGTQTVNEKTDVTLEIPTTYTFLKDQKETFTYSIQYQPVESLRTYTIQGRATTQVREPAPECGNGILRDTEICDYSVNPTVSTCTDELGLDYQGIVYCSNTCQLDKSACQEIPQPESCSSNDQCDGNFKCDPTSHVCLPPNQVCNQGCRDYEGTCITTGEFGFETQEDKNNNDENWCDTGEKIWRECKYQSDEENQCPGEQTCSPDNTCGYEINRIVDPYSTSLSDIQSNGNDKEYCTTNDQCVLNSNCYENSFAKDINDDSYQDFCKENVWVECDPNNEEELESYCQNEIGYYDMELAPTSCSSSGQCQY